MIPGKALASATSRCLCLLALVSVAPPLWAAQPESPFSLMLLEVRLGTEVLAEAIPAYDAGEHILVPLGELSRILTLAVQARPAEGVASGYIIDRDRTFSLSIGDARVTLSGKTVTLDSSLVLAEPDDIYVAETLIEQWFPVELDIRRFSQVLSVTALEELPLQARARRQSGGAVAGHTGRYEAPMYNLHASPYGVVDAPFIDQTLATDIRSSDGKRVADTRYTAFVTGDLLGLESSFYIAEGTRDSEFRGTMGRTHPGGELLGPLKARSYRFGSLVSPNVENLTRGRSGEGVLISNRPLTQPVSFDSQTFDGDLAPGWDVELYYNGALIDFRVPDVDGRYRFEDLPLSYGRNDFRLVFNGPLGQTRTEEYSYDLDSSLVRPGEVNYNFVGHNDEFGQPGSIAQLEFGLTGKTTVSTSYVSAFTGDTERRYGTLGVLTFLESYALDTSYIQANDGGRLWGVGVQSRIFGIAVDADRFILQDFVSDEFLPVPDPVSIRDEVRLSGRLPLGARTHLPAVLAVRHDQLESGEVETELNFRTSAYVRRTALTNTLSWQDRPSYDRLQGSLLVSRRFLGLGFRSVVNYDVTPESDVTSLSLTGDYDLARGYRVTGGGTHHLNDSVTLWNAGFSKSLGRYGLGVTGQYATDGDYGVGLRFFLGLGRDGRDTNWNFAAQPMAGYGAASVQVFLDENGNNIMDVGEEPVPGVGFLVNGAYREATTNEAGIARIERLSVNRYVDIAINDSSLIDPQWQPAIPGVSLMPRPGHVIKLDLPIRLTSEIDGTVFLLSGEAEGTDRGVGGIQLQLLDEAMKVIATTATAWDGFYIFSAIAPGQYWMQVNPEQIRKEGWEANGFRVVDVPTSGDFVSGVDLWLTKDLPASNKGAGKNRNVEFAGQTGAADKSPAIVPSWVSRQPEDNFTIQLSTVGSRSSLDHFLAEHGIARQAAVVESSRNGKVRYSVVYGSYANYGAARGAFLNLPDALRKAKPWIRRFAEIQGLQD